MFVWYPIGVIKLADAPKHTATNRGLESIPTDDEIDNAIGTNIMATAALEKKAESTNVNKYKIEI